MFVHEITTLWDVTVRHSFELILRYIVPGSWLINALIAVVPARAEDTVWLVMQATSFFFSGFATRLAFGHYRSRYQIAGFVGAAALFETMRLMQRPGAPSFFFFAVATVGASFGVGLARPISHKFWLEPW